jgi:hypothetical protein
MSIFASKVQRTIEIPFGDRADGSPHTITIQQLSGKQAARAREASQIAQMEAFRRMGGAEVQREMSAFGDPAKQAELLEKAQADPLNSYDRTEVILRGLKAWTYDAEISAATVDDLSEEAAEFIARAILTLTLPKQDEASQKNDSRPSTGTWTVTGHNQSRITTAV